MTNGRTAEPPDDTPLPGSPDDRSDEPGGLPPGGWFGLRTLPAAWMRGLLVTVTGMATVIIALGDLASAWVLVVLPVTVAMMVAYHEFLERRLAPAAPGDRHPEDG